jgi:hypothetical protein
MYNISDRKPWEQRLIVEFPDLYLETNSSSSDSSFLRYGFECDGGWEALIWEFSTKAVQLLAEARQIDPQSFIKASIVKQKLTLLKWHCTYELPSHQTEQLLKIIAQLRNDSGITCEKCGAFADKRETRPNCNKALCTDCFCKRREPREPRAAQSALPEGYKND